MKSTLRWPVAMALLLSALPLAARAGTTEESRLVMASEVLDEMRGQPDQNVPSWLLQRAYGVAVIPDVLKGALIFGGRHGNGVLSIRNDAGHFSSPIFISLTGGSFGWQIGAESTDVVLIFATRRSVEYFARGTFTLGASGSVAAGPVGRQGEAAAGLNAEVYAYSRTRGLFAGVALDGTALIFDKKANRAYYGLHDISTEQIANGSIVARAETARRFLEALASTAQGSPAAPASTAPANTTLSAPAAPTGAPAPAGAAHTFPMEDPHPGSEPK